MESYDINGMRKYLDDMYNTQKKAIKPMYQQQRNTSDYNTAMDTQALREELSGLGQRGGTNIRENVALRTASGQRMNDINTAENTAKNEIETNRNNSMFQLAQAEQARQDMLDQRDYERGMSNKEFDYRSTRDEIEDAYRNGQISREEAQQAINNDYRQNAFAYQQGQDSLNRQDMLNNRGWEQSLRNPNYFGQVLQNQLLGQQLKYNPQMLAAQLRQLLSVIGKNNRSGSGGGGGNGLDEFMIP